MLPQRTLTFSINGTLTHTSEGLQAKNQDAGQHRCVLALSNARPAMQVILHAQDNICCQHNSSGKSDNKLTLSCKPVAHYCLYHPFLKGPSISMRHHRQRKPQTQFVVRLHLAEVGDTTRWGGEAVNICCGCCCFIPTCRTGSRKLKGGVQMTIPSCSLKPSEVVCSCLCQSRPAQLCCTLFPAATLTR